MNRLHLKLEKIGRNPHMTAKSVGLCYSINPTKGYYRQRTTNGFAFVDENKKPIRDKVILERIAKLVIPPAWEHVWICAQENGHLQATGIDAKGRKQYRYHAQWNKIRNQSKFHKLLKFAQALPKIRQQIDIDLVRKGMPYEKVVALVVKLIELTHIRIGNDAYRKLYGSFGLTTLRDKHVKFENSNIFFDFVGKKGIKHKINLTSRKMVNLVKKCRDIPGQELFQYYDDEGKRHTIGSSDINKYLKSITAEDNTAKDFRAWAGSVNALGAFLQKDAPQGVTDCRKKVIEVLDEVAHKLGNTRSVCKKYDVHPTIIAAFTNGAIHKYRPRKSGSGLDPEEFALVKLLQNEKIAEVIC